MRKNWGWWQWAGFIFSTLAGTLLHFAYDWSGGSPLVAPFAALNESTWEHMKLLFLPTFLYAIAQSFLFKDREDFWCIKLKGILLGLTLIPTIFYTYNGVFGRSPDWLNISIFFISAATVFIYETRLFNSKKPCRISKKWALSLLFAIAVMFIIFTFRTPRLNVFKDPITSAYGIQ